MPEYAPSTVTVPVRTPTPVESTDVDFVTVTGDPEQCTSGAVDTTMLPVVEVAVALMTTEKDGLVGEVGVVVTT